MVILLAYTAEIIIMSKLLSLKIRDDIFLEVEKITKKKYQETLTSTRL